MRNFPVLFLLLFSASLLWAQNSTNSGTSDSTKFYLMPMDNKSDLNTYPNSRSSGVIIYNSLYTFLRIVPGINLPDAETISSITNTNSFITPAEISSSLGTEISINGSYQFTGKEDVKINIQILSIKDNKKIMDKTYTSKNGIELLDTADAILSDILSASLSIKMQTATLKFGSLETGRYAYDLYLNNKLVTVVSNQTGFNTRILAGQKYNLRLHRKTEPGEFFVLLDSFSTNFTPLPNETVAVSYLSKGSIYIKPLDHFVLFQDYSMELNGKKVIAEKRYNDLTAGTNYLLKVLDKNTNTVYTESQFLKEGGLNTYFPTDRENVNGINPSIAFTITGSRNFNYNSANLKLFLNQNKSKAWMAGILLSQFNDSNYQVGMSSLYFGRQDYLLGSKLDLFKAYGRYDAGYTFIGSIKDANSPNITVKTADTPVVLTSGFFLEAAAGLEIGHISFSLGAVYYPLHIFTGRPVDIMLRPSLEIQFAY